MASFLEKNREQRAKVKKELAEGLAIISSQLQALGARKIILFGSYSSGDVHQWSDLDLLVVMPNTKTSKEWLKEIPVKVERPVAADIFPYTPEDFEHMKTTSRFIRHAITTGRVIYERKE